MTAVSLSETIHNHAGKAAADDCGQVRGVLLVQVGFHCDEHPVSTLGRRAPAAVNRPML